MDFGINKKYNRFYGEIMKSINLNELQNSDFTVKDIVIMEQCWQEGGEFNALNRPKKNQSFVYLNGCCVDYYFPDGSVLHAKEQDFVYIPKGARYKARFFNKSKQIGVVLINFNLQYKENKLNIWDKVLVAYSENNGVMKDLFAKLEPENLSIFERKACFYRILEILRRYETVERISGSHKYGLIAPAVKFLDECETMNVSVEELAAMCHVSGGFFRSKFRECFGMSPKDYCLNKRLVKAKQLLKTGELNISEVSDLLEFSSPSYFCRIFKKKIGESPQKYKG